MTQTSSNSTPTPTGPLPGMKVEYNLDVEPLEALLHKYEGLRLALHDDRVLTLFRGYDAQARHAKRWFYRLGLLFLALLTLPLALAALRLTFGGLPIDAVCGWVGDICGGLAVLLLLSRRLSHYRREWCTALFCRERLRQWHFQKFLNGDLIGHLPDDKDGYKTDLDKRWAEFKAQLHGGYGSVTAFLDGGTVASARRLHAVKTYARPGQAEQVLDALWSLRLQHQLQYAGQQIGPDGQLDRYDKPSGNLAAFSLVGALLAGVAAFAIAVAHPPYLSAAAATTGPTAAPRGGPDWTQTLMGVTFLLAVVSAASRAFRDGYTLPAEPESYREYANRLQELAAALNQAKDPKDKLDQMALIEEESAAELARFLRMKVRASFVQ